MPRYHFDVTDAVDFSRDEHGLDCADDQEARIQADTLLPDLARERLQDGDQHEFVVAVRDEAGGVVCEASLDLYGALVTGPALMVMAGRCAVIVVAHPAHAGSFALSGIRLGSTQRSALSCADNRSHLTALAVA